METSTTIKDLFDGRDFAIPSYQRAYSWEEKHLSQFIDDLNECGDAYPCHLGHFLFEEEGDTLYVIDGQQRLATCVIFFSVAGKVLGLGDKPERYLKNKRGEQKFKTVPYDNDFFIDAIIEYKEEEALPKEDTSSKKAMREARLYFEKRLKEASVEDVRKWVDRLEGASITTHVVGSKAEAAQIFAYQNDRGKELTKLEVLKAYLSCELFKCGGSEGDISYIENIFADIYKAIVRISSLDKGNVIGEDDVLYYYWQAKGPQGYYSRDAVLEAKAWLKGFSEKERACKIKEFAEGLKTAFNLVEKIKANDSFDEETAYFVACLNRLESLCKWLSYPMLIKAQALGVDDKVFCRLVKLAENLGFRTWVSWESGIVDCLQEVFKDINDAESFIFMIDKIKDCINKRGSDWGFLSDSSVFKKYINDGYFYKNDMCNYLLWRYERYLRHEEGASPNVSWEDVIFNESIEHIAPQNLRTPDNPHADGYGVYEDKDNPTEGIESGEWLHCVGNLALTAKNSRLSNLPFEEKLKIYGESDSFNQEKEIITFATGKNKKHPVWDKAAIKRRHNRILKAAKEIWDLGRI